MWPPSFSPISMAIKTVNRSSWLRCYHLPVPTIVGTKANMMGSIRSPLKNLVSERTGYTYKEGHTFLSEYQPHASVVKAATIPPGVERINVCLELERQSQYIFGTEDYKIIRVSKTFDDYVADCNACGQLLLLEEDERGAQLLRPPFGMLATEKLKRLRLHFVESRKTY